MSKPADNKAAPPGENTEPAHEYGLTHRILAHWPAALALYRVAILFIGLLVIAFGILLLPLPGPGWVVIFAGLWILAREFPAARRIVVAFERWFLATKHYLNRRRARKRARREREPDREIEDQDDQIS